MNRWLPIVGLILITGCAQSRFVGGLAKPGLVRSYELGEVQRAAVGEPIFGAHSGVWVPTFVVRREYRPPRAGLAGGSARPIPAGTVFRAIRQDPTKGTYLLSSAGDVGKGYEFEVTPDGRIVGVLVEGGAPFRSKLPRDPVFERSEDVKDWENPFRAEIIYSGLDGNTLKAVYREYSGDLIRPAFSQELQYDLSADRMISFRTVEIEVRNATNSFVEYVVNRDGDLPWLPGAPTPTEASARGTAAAEPVTRQASPAAPSTAAPRAASSTSSAVKPWVSSFEGQFFYWHECAEARSIPAGKRLAYATKADAERAGRNLSPKPECQGPA